MIKLIDKPLPSPTVEKLNEYQNLVDAQQTFTDQVKEGKRLFSNYNKKANPAFKVIRKHLSEMSGGTVRCSYCEDSNANQVEHIYPKNFYPNRCFIWNNYCYACGPCNQPKSDKFAINVRSSDTEINLKQPLKDIPPPEGNPLLIDPRNENPMEFLYLDLMDTFKFVPFSDNEKDQRRAEYTIEILGLNSRNHLVKAREVAFGNYKARLYEYVNKKENGTSEPSLTPLIQSFQAEHHKTVWQEMKRQRKHFDELNDLLNRADEALKWI